MIHKKHTAILIAILVIAVVVSIALISVKNNDETNSPLILTTFPGIDKDIQLLLSGCNVDIEHLVPSGVDPHDYQLRPSDYEKINSALIIISTGHTPFEQQIKDLSGDKVIEIPKIPGLIIYTLPSGATNLHMPIYNPLNYKKYIEYISNSLELKLPECTEIIEENKVNLSEKAETIYEKNKDILNGKPAILSSPASQYAVAWLGVDIKGFILVEHEASTSPEQVSLAEETLRNGGLAVIIVDNNGEPIGQASSYLYDLAKKYESSIIKVPAPYLDTSTLDKIIYVASQAEELGR